MRKVVAKCLRDDFSSGSMAHLRYLLYAKKAEDENFSSVACLFRALALSRYIRAAEQYRLASELLGAYTACAETHFTLARTIDNLERARNDEKVDAEETLPAYVAVAESQGEGAAAKIFRHSVLTSHHMAVLLEDVIQKTRHAGEEPKIGQLYVCSTCGSVSIEAAVDGCPICGSKRTGFINIT